MRALALSVNGGASLGEPTKPGLTLPSLPATLRCFREGERMLRRMPAIVSAVAGLAFGLFGAELTFGSLRPDEQRAETVLYSIEVRNEKGDLLASPMLVGEEGRPLHLSLAGPHSDPMAMSLDLDPQSAGGDNLCLGYRLSIDDGFAHAGRAFVSYGEQRSLQLRGGGESLRLSLVVTRAHSPQFDRLLSRRRRPTT